MVNNEIRLIIFFVAEDGNDLYIVTTKTRPGDDCSSDHELLIVKFRLIEECKEKHLTIYVGPKSNPLCLYSLSEK